MIAPIVPIVREGVNLLLLYAQLHMKQKLYTFSGDRDDCGDYMETCPYSGVLRPDYCLKWGLYAEKCIF